MSFTLKFCKQERVIFPDTYYFSCLIKQVQWFLQVFCHQYRYCPCLLSNDFNSPQHFHSSCSRFDNPSLITLSVPFMHFFRSDDFIFATSPARFLLNTVRDARVLSARSHACVFSPQWPVESELFSKLFPFSNLLFESWTTSCVTSRYFGLFIFFSFRVLRAWLETSHFCS